MRAMTPKEGFYGSHDAEDEDEDEQASKQILHQHQHLSCQWPHDSIDPLDQKES
jgi:hypothetical protein